ncbi:MAG: type VI secretion system Vgr family protein, partial [Aquabacterium sp.]
MTDLSGIQHAVRGAVDAAPPSLLDQLQGTGIHQHTRLLRLHTPLGRQVLMAERVRVHEALTPEAHQAFHMDVLALSTQAHLNPNDLIGQTVLLELLTDGSHALAGSTSAWRPFHGHVLAMQLLGSDGGLARYHLQIGSWLDLLAHRTDSWVFQHMSVVDLTEAIFRDYQAQGKLTPQWRWELANPQAYPVRSLCVQHAETDLAFLQRLWAEEGLYAWFEHTGQPGEPSLGTHTLVLADHPGAFQPHAPGPLEAVRFTQASAVLQGDSLRQWHAHRQVAPTELITASWDHRSVSNHTGHSLSDAEHNQPMPLRHVDQPGAYAHETPEHAQRLATVQMQALQSQRKRFQGEGTVRTLRPGSTFKLYDHPRHADGDRFVVLSVTHTARNNLSADEQAGLVQRLGAVNLPGFGNDSTEPLYQGQLSAQRVGVPYRAPCTPEGLNKPQARVHGLQTALVVGLGPNTPVHTDRDNRIKVQFHWQRGAQASHRLNHLTGDDNAPASDASGTWVRVAQSWAGQNWGAVFVPRVGQEVLVGFLEGDADRPVVLGAAYNGEGQPNAPGNRIGGGAAGATGNAPAWFPGSKARGELEGHAHTACLSGFKSQSLEASQHGGGGYNQLVMDDTPGQGRVLLHTTQQQTWLQMGHLLQQADNLRLAHRGHGLELHTQAQAALRAASGLHLSTHARPAGTTSAQGQPMNSREAQQQLSAHAQLLTALAANAKTHRADLPQEPEAAQLPAHQGLQATLQSLKGTQASEHGRMPTTERPDLLLSGAAAITTLTPAHTVLSAGRHATVTTTADLNLLAQRHQAWAVKN